MKAKKLLMPLALIFFALFLGVKPAKAQTQAVYVTAPTAYSQWTIDYYNLTTGEEFFYDGTAIGSDLHLYGYALLGNLPNGYYRVTVTNYTNGSYFDIYGADNPIYNWDAGYGGSYILQIVEVNDGMGSIELSYDF